MIKKLPIIKSIFIFAIPILFANLISSGYQLVDAFWVGRLGPLAVAGVANAGSIMFLMMSIGIGFSIAGGALTAQYFGAKDQKMINKTSAQTILASVLASIILSLIAFFSLKPFFRLIDVPSDVLPYALSFAKVALIGTVFNFAFMMFQSVMRPIGEMKTPIYIGLLSVALNFFFDPFFIFGFHSIPAMGVSGAAMATIVTQSIAAAIGFYILFNGKHGIKLHLKDFIPDFSFIKRTFFLGFPGSIEMGSRSFSAVILMFLVNIFGGTAIAAYGVGGNVFMLTTMMPCMAFSIAVSILVGHKLGAGDKKSAREVANLGMILTFVVVAFFSAFSFVFAKNLLQFFIPNDSSVLELGIFYLRVIALAAPLISLQFSASAILRASGNMVSSMMVSLISIWALQVPIAIYLSKYAGYGVKGVYISGLFSSLLIGIFIIFYLKYKKWENKDLIKRNTEKIEENLKKDIEEEMMIGVAR
ncbi:MAG: MATE family efflux transporter [Candidatus Nomurabacteria bacterium]